MVFLSGGLCILLCIVCTELKQLTFEDYLRNHDLSENLVQYVLLCIAMTEGNVPALEVNYY